MGVRWAKWIVLGIAAGAAILGRHAYSRPHSGGHPESARGRRPSVPVGPPAVDSPPVDRSDPLAVASAVAVAVFQSDSRSSAWTERLVPPVSAHAAALMTGLAPMLAGQDRRSTAAQISRPGSASPSTRRCLCRSGTEGSGEGPVPAPRPCRTGPARRSS